MRLFSISKVCPWFTNIDSHVFHRSSRGEGRKIHFDHSFLQKTKEKLSIFLKSILFILKDNFWENWSLFFLFFSEAFFYRKGQSNWIFFRSPRTSLLYLYFNCLPPEPYFQLVFAAFTEILFFTKCPRYVIMLQGWMPCGIYAGYSVWPN